MPFASNIASWPVHCQDVSKHSIDYIGWETFSTRQTNTFTMSSDGNYLVSGILNTWFVEVWSISSFPALVLVLCPSVNSFANDSQMGNQVITSKHLCISSSNKRVACIYESRDNSKAQDASSFFLIVWDVTTSECILSKKFLDSVLSIELVNDDMVILSTNLGFVNFDLANSKATFVQTIENKLIFNSLGDSVDLIVGIDFIFNKTSNENKILFSTTNKSEFSQKKSFFILEQHRQNINTFNLVHLMYSSDMAVSCQWSFVQRIDISHYIPSVTNANGEQTQATPIQIVSNDLYVMILFLNGGILRLGAIDLASIVYIPLYILAHTLTSSKPTFLGIFSEEPESSYTSIAVVYGSRVIVWDVPRSITNIIPAGTMPSMIDSKIITSKVLRDHIPHVSLSSKIGSSFYMAQCHPKKKIIFSTDRSFRLSVIREHLTSDFSGPEYPVGFKVIQKVISYQEEEDELDHNPKSSPTILENINVSNKISFRTITMENRFIIPINLESFQHLILIKSSSILTSTTTALNQNNDLDPYSFQNSKRAKSIGDILPIPKRLKSDEFIKSILEARSKGHEILAVSGDQEVLELKIKQFQNEVIENQRKAEEQKMKERMKKEEAKRKKQEASMLKALQVEAERRALVEAQAKQGLLHPTINRPSPSVQTQQYHPAAPQIQGQQQYLNHQQSLQNQLHTNLKQETFPQQNHHSQLIPQQQISVQNPFQPQPQASQPEIINNQNLPIYQHSINPEYAPSRRQNDNTLIQTQNNITAIPSQPFFQTQINHQIPVTQSQHIANNLREVSVSQPVQYSAQPQTNFTQNSVLLQKQLEDDQLRSNFESNAMKQHQESLPLISESIPPKSNETVSEVMNILDISAANIAQGQPSGLFNDPK